MYAYILMLIMYNTVCLKLFTELNFVSNLSK